MSAPAPSMYSPEAKQMAEKLGLKMGRANLEEFADTLLALARENRDILAVTSDSRGSGKLGPFAQALPDQLVELGIAEQNLVGVSAGLASAGKTVFAVSPACFLTARALEQIKNDVAYSDNPVNVVGISAGVSYGALGSTHHSLHDLAALRAINNIDILVPADNFETARIIRHAAHVGTPPTFASAKPPSTTSTRTPRLSRSANHSSSAMAPTSPSSPPAKPSSTHSSPPALSQNPASPPASSPCTRSNPSITTPSSAPASNVAPHHRRRAQHPRRPRRSLAATLMQAAVAIPFHIAAIPDEHTVTGSQADIFRHYGLSMEGLAQRAAPSCPRSPHDQHLRYNWDASLNQVLNARDL